MTETTLDLLGDSQTLQNQQEVVPNVYPTPQKENISLNLSRSESKEIPLE
jgi:hypothetical protein